MYIDSHCHLNMIDLSDYDNSLDNLIRDTQNAKVSQMLSVAVTLDEVPTLKELAGKYPHIHTSVGMHPNEDLSYEVTVDEIIKLADDDNVVAIGETGLDHYRTEEADYKTQEQRFRTHIKAAKIVNKPLIIHTRNARENTMRVMEEEGASDVGAVMHCFTETKEMASWALDLGFYISFSGIVTFNSAKELQEVAQFVPLDKMLIETDSPYLAPVPFRGKPNVPTYVPYVAQKIAELKGEPVEIIANATTENYLRLFPLAKI